MADAAPVTTPAPAPSVPPNGAAAPGKVAPKPVVEVKPKVGATPVPAGEKLVEFTDHTGQTHKLTEKELAAYYHRGKAAQKTLTEWDRKRQEYERKEFDFNAKAERLKSDPDALEDFLTSQGVPRATVEKFLAKAINHDTLNEDQKALAEERRKREALEAKEKEREEQEKDQQYQATVEQHRQELVNLFTDAMQQADIPEQLASVLFPRMAGLYRAAKKAGMQPEPSMFAQHLASALDDLVAKRAATTPLEKLEGLIGKRKHKFAEDGPEEEVDYATYVRRRDLAALRAKRAGVPGNAAAPAAAPRASAGSIDLPGEVVRSMPADLQNAYYAMQSADPEEAPSKRQRFTQLARKYNVKI